MAKIKKPSLGRPMEVKDGRNVLILLPDEIFKLVKRDAYNEERSVASVVRRALRQHYNLKRPLQ
jgi:hypothetical protein